MISIAFPNMLSPTKTNLTEDREATIQNTKLILKSIKGSLFGDPYFGTNLVRGLYEFNDNPVIELIRDEIYVTLNTFIPQLRLDKNKGLEFFIKGSTLYITITAGNMIKFTTDLYDLNLTRDRDNG